METIEINLEECKNLNEGRYSTLGLQVKRILRAMFGGHHIPMNVKGTRREIDSFLDTLVKEKKYMSAYLTYGLNDPRTHRDRAKLGIAVSNFERHTGIKWPFK
jgi:hypothetical protein